MEFPARRIMAREAAIAHELVHVFFPSGNRFLAEGLATYLQAAMRKSGVSKFRQALHKNVQERFLKWPQLFHAGRISLKQILADLDAIQTRSPPTLQLARKST